jgi:hypothetical protein
MGEEEDEANCSKSMVEFIDTIKAADESIKNW